MHDDRVAPHLGAPSRSVVLVGPPGAGRTALVAALAARTGAGAVTPGAPGALAAVVVTHAGVRLALLDAPGTPDLAGAVQAGLRAADAALFVVSAAGGLDAPTVQLWAECAEAGVPRAVVVTRIDVPGADVDEAVALCQRVLDEEALPLHLPLHGEDDAVAGLIDLLTSRVHDWSSGEPVDRDPDPEHLPLIASLRAELVEAVLAGSEDESLLDDYLDDVEPDPAVLRAELARAVFAGDVTAVVAVSSVSGVGTDELLDLLVTALPAREAPPVTDLEGAPALPLTGDPRGPLAAQAVGAAGGRALLRVFSGTLRPGDPVQLAGPGGSRSAAVDGLWSPLGAALTTLDDAPAGAVCAAGLELAAGDTVSAPGGPLVLPTWPVPVPLLPVALTGATVADLAPLLAADPSLAAVQRGGQLLLWCVGEVHAAVALDRLRAAGVAVDRAPLGVSGTTWELDLSVPTPFVRSVVSDLSGRGVTVLDRSVDPASEERVVLRTRLPDAALVELAPALAAVSHGTARAVRRTRV